VHAANERLSPPHSAAASSSFKRPAALALPAHGSTAKFKRNLYPCLCETEEEVTRLLRQFADWIYRQLEVEHDYQLSDENADETIRANDYEFTSEGKRRAVIG
jgi:hypothetical protein